MISIKETSLYSEILKEFNYPFGNISIFDGFVVSEINRGVVFNWDNHGKLITEDISCFLGTNGNDIVYVSNRIHSYSLVASDWLKFFKHSYLLKSYLVVSNDKIKILNSMVESLFFNDKIKRFNSLYAAINFVRKGVLEVA
ncbi:hypothetical protein [Thalassobellus suaedae]|uniref:Uncharacterized protein n=1 Tax=Thalassobellus suaedae TaxID=3074124 RepID=A0ABY9XUR8_9FLAO|nr:hypothetical protein RHP51_02755 [Flavobacteriaceae bacterium HL-DH14]